MKQGFIRREEVTTLTGLSRSTIYRYMDKGIFPRPVPLGVRSVGWVKEEVLEWLASRIQVRDERYGRM